MEADIADPIFSCVIPGRPMVKKNSRRLFMRGRRPISLPSVKFTHWERVALNVLVREKMRLGIIRPLDFPLHLVCTFNFENRQAEPDLTNLFEGIQDALQTAKIIENDRLIQSVDGSRKVFGTTPALTAVLYRYDV